MFLDRGSDLVEVPNEHKLEDPETVYLAVVSGGFVPDIARAAGVTVQEMREMVKPIKARVQAGREQPSECEISLEDARWLAKQMENAEGIPGTIQSDHLDALDILDDAVREESKSEKELKAV